MIAINDICSNPECYKKATIKFPIKGNGVTYEVSTCKECFDKATGRVS